jgi:hypothetical protein
MTDVVWVVNQHYLTATRAECAVVDDYELIVLDVPSGPATPGFISWELYGPPDYNRLVEDGECATFEEAKVKAAEALERATKQE